MVPEPTVTTPPVLAGAAAGDPDAVRALLDDVGPVVYGFVFARVGGHGPVAEDITQDTLVEACRSAHTFRGEAALSTWVCAIARRRLARHFEQERREQLARSGLVPVGDGPEADAQAAGELDGVDRQDAVVRALGRLPALHRQVLVLKYLDDRSVAEIADELGRTPVQVQSLLQRARDGFRREASAGEGGAGPADPGADGSSGGCGR